MILVFSNDLWLYLFVCLEGLWEWKWNFKVEIEKSCLFIGNENLGRLRNGNLGSKVPQKNNLGRVVIYGDETWGLCKMTCLPLKEKRMIKVKFVIIFFLCLVISSQVSTSKFYNSDSLQTNSSLMILRVTLTCFQSFWYIYLLLLVQTDFEKTCFH